MDVYIEGMEIPSTEMDWTIRCGDDNNWYALDTNAETTDGEWHRVVPVSDNTRLLDLDTIKPDMTRLSFLTNEKEPIGYSIEIIEGAPSIEEK